MPMPASTALLVTPVLLPPDKVTLPVVLPAVEVPPGTLPLAPVTTTPELVTTPDELPGPLSPLAPDTPVPLLRAVTEAAPLEAPTELAEPSTCPASVFARFSVCVAPPHPDQTSETTTEAKVRRCLRMVEAQHTAGRTQPKMSELFDRS